MILLKAVFRVKIEKEQKEIEDENEDSTLKPYVVTFQVENHRIDGKTIGELHMVIDHDFVVSRMKVKETGEVIIPTSKTVVSKGDLLLTVCSIQDESAFQMVIGPVVDMEWEAESQSNVVSRRILVTKSHYNGRTLGSLRLHNGYNLNATRVNRAGLDLLANPNLKLQVGDRITVVGDPSHIERLATRLGNSMKRLHEPNMVTMFIGIFIGIIVGSIPFAIPLTTLYPCCPRNSASSSATFVSDINSNSSPTPRQARVSCCAKWASAYSLRQWDWAQVRNSPRLCLTLKA